MPKLRTTLLICSLAVNLLGVTVFFGVLFFPGLGEKLRARMRVTNNVFRAQQQVRRMQFTVAAPANRPELVFAGDSLTEFGLWNEWCTPVTFNRGVSTETSADLFYRAGELASLHPKILFLMIGTNDANRFSAEQTATHVAETIAVIRRESPGTACYVQSVLPKLLPDGGQIVRINSLLKQQAPAAGYQYLEVDRFFFDGGGHPLPALYLDGVHLAPEGYRAWLRALPPELITR